MPETNTVYGIETTLYNLKVLNQTFQDFEIVVVDDGSGDGTRSIILEYVKSHPEKVRPFFQENRGAAAARNKGAEMAAGQWLADNSFGKLSVTGPTNSWEGF